MNGKGITGWVIVVTLVGTLFFIGQPAQQMDTYVQILIDDGDSLILAQSAVSGTTALEALETYADRSGTQLSYLKTGKCTAYVTSIAGVEEGSSGASSGWIYYVEDETTRYYPDRAADCFSLLNYKVLGWKFLREGDDYIAPGTREPLNFVE